MTDADLTQAANLLITAVISAASNAKNEESLRHETEIALEKCCKYLSIPWTPYQLDRTLFKNNGGVRFADVIHGGVIIEYEPPNCFGSREQGAQLAHAKSQAEEYSELTSIEEGRPLTEYDLVVWDGASIAFGRYRAGAFEWDRLTAFDLSAARNLLRKMAGNAAPLVSPSVLKSYIGLDSSVGAQLIPLFFNAIASADKRGKQGKGGGKTYLLFREWGRIFGQAIGINTERLESLIQRQAASHGTRYQDNIPAYLFSLHSYLALVAKLVAALALPSASQNITDSGAALRSRIEALEKGKIFEDSGITNMLAGDFFSWPTDAAVWPTIEPGTRLLLEKLSDISFDLSKKNISSVRDLFKGLYEVFVPRELRHALGEVYTPDWLAAYVLDRVGWLPENDLLDPTCGTGTFVLEALKRRIAALDGTDEVDCSTVLRGIFGIDLNPLAVLAAKSSIVVVLSGHLDPDEPITLPIYLADAINIARVDDDDIFRHTLQTELGPRDFAVPAKIVRSGSLFEIFGQLRDYISANFDAARIYAALQPMFDRQNLTPREERALRQTIVTLHDLHSHGWDGIWCAILADRFAAGSIQRVSHIIGNPPWVKWSHLPPEYAQFIKPLCQELNAFSEDRYVGGIESDISTIITMQAVIHSLAPGGLLAFLITATLFSNASSQGFRRMHSNDGEPIAGFQYVEDFKAIAPFDGVTNHPSLMVLRQGEETAYPIPYRVWTYGNGSARKIDTASSFLNAGRVQELLASPVPGTDAGPWLRGTAADQELWGTLFNARLEDGYQARKGITTDLNGVYFVRTGPVQGRGIQVTNDPSIGRTEGLPSVTRTIEETHVFPLARGRGLKRFSATTDPHFKVIIPQRGMHGDPTLPTSARRTHAFLATFQSWLEQRGSYRRYQSKQPFWSTWSTGPYTFAPYKVLWKEMSGARFCAAYIGSEMVGSFGPKVVVPDHKLYFVPVQTLDEAQYLTAILNARTVSRAISAYAAQLSLGVSVIEYLRIPAFDPDDDDHLSLTELAELATNSGGLLSAEDEDELDQVALRVMRV